MLPYHLSLLSFVSAIMASRSPLSLSEITVQFIIHSKHVFTANDPKSLYDKTLQSIIRNKHLFADYDAVTRSYTLRRGVTIPVQVCDDLVQAQKRLGNDLVRAHNRLGNLSDKIDDSFMQIFRNPECIYKIGEN